MSKPITQSIITALLFLLPAIHAAPAQPPNIVFIFTDDHSPNAIGAYNRWLKSVNPTPAIDRLASQGMLFERSYCTNSICAETIARLDELASQYQDDTDVSEKPEEWKARFRNGD